MLFTQIEFFFIFPLIWGMLALAGSNRVRKGLLLAVGLYLYGYWDWRFAALLVGCVTATYVAALRVQSSGSARQKTFWMWAGVGINLAVLGVFKYLGFFIESLNALLEPTGWRLGALQMLLPVGISFFTFQLISYCADVRTGRLQATRSLPDLLLYISYFPHVFAGPIVRASQFLPQLQTRPQLARAQVMEGFCLFVFGLFQKVFIADRLAPHVDTVFTFWSTLDALSLGLGTLAFAAQIYCDFAGYSNMAVGLSRMMGYELCLNFLAPYRACSIADFWRRWHISLSSWLRDYLYIPLGGSRCAEWRVYVNLLTTMLLGGLWHGAAWTFVVWGGLHGIALCVQRWWSRRSWLPPVPSGAGWGLTMLVVMVGWVFFRAPTLADAWGMLRGLMTWQSGVTWCPPFTIAVVLAWAATSIATKSTSSGTPRFDPASVRTASLVLCLLVFTLLFRPEGLNPFVYFQF